MRDKLEAIRRLDVDLVSPIDGLQDRADLVITVITTAQHAQIEINLGEGLQLHKDE